MFWRDISIYETARWFALMIYLRQLGFAWWTRRMSVNILFSQELTNLMNTSGCIFVKIFKKYITFENEWLFIFYILKYPKVGSLKIFFVRKLPTSKKHENLIVNIIKCQKRSATWNKTSFCCLDFIYFYVIWIYFSND